MKKTYPVSNNAKHVCSWRKHLRPEEKRRVNKSTRKLGRAELATIQRCDEKFISEFACDYIWK